MSRLDNILNNLNAAEKPDTAKQSSDVAIPLSFIAHNEMIVRNAERALSQLASLDNTKVFIVLAWMIVGIVLMIVKVLKSVVRQLVNLDYISGWHRIHKILYQDELLCMVEDVL